MKTVDCRDIEAQVAAMCISAAIDLPEDVETATASALSQETIPQARNFLQQYLDNAGIARQEKLPICQDTGVAVFFVELGHDVHITGGNLKDAISQGTAKGYEMGYLRKSIVRDPVFGRSNTGDNTPPVIHLDLVPGDSLKITLAPKGGGSENMSTLTMLKPADGQEGVIQFVVDTVTKAGGNPCPPTIVGVGIGGDFEMCAILAKKALLRETGQANPDPAYAELEQEILAKINASGVGSQGLGGDITAFAVHIEYAPCHIASLPVAVNLNCHAARHKEIVL